MKIYTSYWAQLRNFPPNLVALSTVVFEPKWYRVGGKDKNGVISIRCNPFRPGKECDGLCNGKCNPRRPEVCEFLKTYRKQLDRLDVKQVLQRLTELAAAIKLDEGFDDVDFAFIVFEKYDNPCSERWPIQAWFRENGVEIEEWHPQNITKN